ncbi:MAG: hypothetical protein CVU56_28135 [Deltaproteobacteria bacterium HGW-Deltaproteobacteria-14]|jgi:hypothetical protein|nr:MAG: hypothetical protein CVU56_28135 [Deltaproteobacteria bacterium HGW-Deltaproteobacteria-14]
MKDRWRLLSAALITTLAAIAAGGCLDASISQGVTPVLELTDRDRAITEATVVTLRGAQSTTITVRNAGDAVLEIRGVSVTSTPPGALFVTASPTPTPAEPVLIYPEGRIDALRSWTFTVGLSPDFDPAGVAGTITVTTNNTIAATNALSFAIEVIEAAPRLSVQPAILDFAQVQPGTTATRQLTLLNTGDAPLEVTHLVLSGHPGFAVVVNGEAHPVTPTTASTGVAIDPPLVIAPGSSKMLEVTFTSTGPEAAEGNLWITSNGAAAGLVVPLSANAHGPCIAVNPTRVDFGGKRVGTSAVSTVDVLSCGDAPLNITALTLVDDAGGVYAIATGAATPLALPPGQSTTVSVTYTPTAAALFDAENNPIRDTAVLAIETDALVPVVEVQLRGFGTVSDCPTAVIIVSEGEEVIPQTKLHLIGSQSFGNAAIAQWRWSVEQPVGSASVFLPSADVADPQFEANVVGTYVLHLTVTDATGTESCEVASYVVTVTTGEAIHIELLWTTPNDPDETDEGPVAGADLDLHFAHPFATGGDIDHDGVVDPWFDSQFDAFWFNPRPNWGSLDPAIDDDPGLDRDDTDGAGPENLNLNQPADVTYRVAVHSWDDHGYGTSFATVRIYLYGNLVFEWADVELPPCALWDVASIAWPAGIVTPRLSPDGLSPVMIPNFSNPFFPNNCGE